ncbi:MAG TPA: DNA polymerase III subunit beta [Candidatus Nanopelagicales bacterium]
MKFRLERDVLADAVAWTARTLPSRPSMPMLAGLLVEVADDGVTLSSFDYEVSGRVFVPADVDEPGRVLVSGRLLADITRSLPAQSVLLSADGSRVEVRCGRSTFTLPTLPVEDYPALPEMPSSSGSATGSSFAEAVAQVAIAAGRDDTLPTLTGIRLEIAGDEITLAATDRYRLAVREMSWSPEHSGLDTAALVPARTLAETAKSLAGCDKVLISLAGPGEGLMGFEGDGRRTTTRLLDGEFPKYRALLPSESATVAVVDTSALSEAVKRVSLVAERNTPVRLAFSGDEVLLRAGAGDEAQATEAVECAVDGESVEIAFNPTYLLDGLGAVGAASTRLSFTSATRPAVLTADAGDPAEAPSYRYLLMPVRLSG